MRLQDEPETPAQINIVPMIDVVFSILTFFIMSSLFLNRSEGLPVNLPKAATSQQARVAQAKIAVTVNKDGKISLNRQPTNIETLTEQLGALVGDNAEALVVINADREVNHGQVVAVMDRVRQVKGAKLAIATQKP